MLGEVMRVAGLATLIHHSGAIAVDGPDHVAEENVIGILTAQR